MPTYMDDLIKEVKKKKLRLDEKDSEPGLKTTDASNNQKKPTVKSQAMPSLPSEHSNTRQKLRDLINPKKELKEKIVDKKIVQKKSMEKPAPIVGKKVKEVTAETDDKQEANKVSNVQQEIQSSEKTLVDSYESVKIYKVKRKTLLRYIIPVRRPTETEKSIINTIKEAATRLITISPYKVRDPNQKRNIYYQKVIEILQNSPQLNIQRRRWSFYADSVVREMVGYGIIDPLVNDDNLEEIMVIGPKLPVYVFHRKYEMMTTNIEFFSDQEIVDLINRIARQVGRRVDISSPLLDARLPDGSRVNATIPPASVIGSSLTIRKFKKDPMTIIDMIKNKTVDIDLAAFLWVCVEGLGVKPANILISGGTGSGKTTLLNALAAFVQPQERIISIEDTAELNLPLKHWIRFEGRPPGLEGSGELTIDIMTKNSLRMRPDRIIVGEIRHAEAFSLFTAMNTGHDGCLGTVHANSSKETIIRVTSPPMNVPEVMLSGLDLIIVEHRLHDKRKGTIRRITDISEVSGVLEHKTKTKLIYEYDHVTDTVKRTKNEIKFLKILQGFTGWTDEKMREEIEKRKVFLKSLSDNNIREMNLVYNACQEFIQNEIEKEEEKNAATKRSKEKD